MRPLAEPLQKLPVLEVIDSNAEQNSGQPEVNVNTEQEERDALYWHEQFKAAQAQNDSYAPYRSILEHLKTSGDLVSVLEQHIKGEIVDPPAHAGTIFDESEDEYGNPVPQKAKQEGTRNVVTPTEETPEQAEQRGRMNALAEVDLKQFLGNLAETGVPEHLQHKFVNTISNPTGFNIADLYAAFENKEVREASDQQNTPVAKQDNMPLGAPVTSAGGATDKPTGDKFKEAPESDGQNFVVNPNTL